MEIKDQRKMYLDEQIKEIKPWLMDEGFRSGFELVENIGLPRQVWDHILHRRIPSPMDISYIYFRSGFFDPRPLRKIKALPRTKIIKFSDEEFSQWYREYKKHYIAIVTFEQVSNEAARNEEIRLERLRQMRKQYAQDIAENPKKYVIFRPKNP